MISVIVPAHNESAVIARTLSTLLSGSGLAEVGVVVVCNGCTDDTSSIARRFGPAVKVIESDIANKCHALNLGDQTSCSFPRIYADADVIITIDAVRALASRLNCGDVLAVAPTPDINLTGCSWPVREYFSVRSRLPSAREGIGGSGVYALSEIGRKRFTQFADVIADDTYVQLHFRPEERETLAYVKSTVFAPRKLPQLLTIRTRAYLGRFEFADRFPALWKNRGETNKWTLVKLFKEPRLWPALLIYCYINTFARFRAAILLRTKTFTWQRDDSSRVLFTDSSK
jgi:glycosyltransferase involved in cell wall biosynthesis